jgi:hypothetical protein
MLLKFGQISIQDNIASSISNFSQILRHNFLCSFWGEIGQVLGGNKDFHQPILTLKIAFLRSLIHLRFEGIKIRVLYYKCKN